MNINPTSPFLLLQRTLVTLKGTGFHAQSETSGSTFVGLGIVILDALAFFVTVPEPRHVVHPHTISHWICQVIQHAHEDVSEQDMRLVQVKGHEVRVVATSALFKKIRSIPAILRAEIWKCMSTFVSFYLRDSTHQYLGTFSLGPVVIQSFFFWFPYTYGSAYCPLWGSGSLNLPHGEICDAPLAPQVCPSVMGYKCCIHFRTWPLPCKFWVCKDVCLGE
ncbi:hypothetical protein E2C01_060492 [Portunus trituberculatus]|uniref:Uncharacterized protein n=1 Tax=Portunus trituberculatus TaxID=210409 RepID=A0A5B7H877_PORTR|nr:hypothetical protein [Portunus trituberculatus]